MTTKFIKSKIYLVFASCFTSDEHLQESCVKAITANRKNYIEEFNGYICKVTHNDNNLYFALQKKHYSSGDWWHISELTTGSSFNNADFKTREKAIEYITEYDFEVFNKLCSSLKRVNSNNTDWLDLLANLNKHNMELLAN